MNRSGIGYGKLLLFGEHAAVYGYPALGCSLPITTRLYYPGEGPEGAVPVPELVRPPLLAAWREIEATFKEAGHPGMPPQERLDYLSSVPMGSGFGSSAAACVALARLIAPPNCGAELLWRAANRGEAVFHGTPSGIDTGLAMGGGLFLIQFEEGRFPRRSPLETSDLYIVAGTVPRERSTKELVAGLAELRGRKPLEVRSRLDRLGAITLEASRLLTESAASEIGALADEAQALLTELDLSSESLDDVLGIARSMGARGAKLSGAGGGGAFYAVAPDRSRAERICTALEEYPTCRPIPPFPLKHLKRSTEDAKESEDAL